MGGRAAAEHFEHAAGGYSGFRAQWPLGALRRLEQEAVRELARVQPGQRVLDAGCGDGSNLQWLSTAGARAVGVDISPSMAKTCLQHGFQVCVQDIEALGLRPVFDWALCIGALEFTERPDVAITALAACLHSSGRLVLLFPRRGFLGWLYAAYHRSHGVRIRLFARNEITGFLKAAGLEPPASWRDCALSSVCVAGRAKSGGGQSPGA